MNMIFFMPNVMHFDTYFGTISMSFDAFSMYVQDFEFFIYIKLMHFDSYFDDISMVFDIFSMDIQCIFNELQNESLKCKLMLFDNFLMQFRCFLME